MFAFDWRGGGGRGTTQQQLEAFFNVKAKLSVCVHAVHSPALTQLRALVPKIVCRGTEGHSPHTRWAHCDSPSSSLSSSPPPAARSRHSADT